MNSNNPRKLAYDAAIAYAASLGAEHGKAAASWTFDGNTNDATYRAVLAMIDAGDPTLSDVIPRADLSGAWAGSLTGPELVEQAIVNADDWTMSRAEWVAYWAEHDADSAICDAYEFAFNDAATAEIERVARYHTATDE